MPRNNISVITSRELSSTASLMQIWDTPNKNNVCAGFCKILLTFIERRDFRYTRYWGRVEFKFSNTKLGLSFQSTMIWVISRGLPTRRLHSNAQEKISNHVDQRMTTMSEILPVPVAIINLFIANHRTSIDAILTPAYILRPLHWQGYIDCS